MDVIFDGKIITMDEDKWRQRYDVKIATMETMSGENGQLEELEAFGKAIQAGHEAPIPFWQQMQAMQIAFAVEAQI